MNLIYRKRKTIIWILSCSQRYSDIFFCEKKSEKISVFYFGPMSNRVNENRRRITVCGGVSASRTTALWFRGWPWPCGSINQWSRRATTESPWLRRLLFYHLSVSRKFQTNSASCVLWCANHWRSRCRISHIFIFACLAAFLSLVASLKRPIHYINIIDAMCYVNNTKIRISRMTLYYCITFVSYRHRFFLQNSKNKRVSDAIEFSWLVVTINIYLTKKKHKVQRMMVEWVTNSRKIC